MAALLGIILAFLSSNVVWDIKVEGNEHITDSAVIKALEDSGFEVGDFWLGCNKAEIESGVLLALPGVSWINLNRRGSVAYVRLVESESEDKNISEEAKGYANIVASADCIIEELTVEKGVAAVKVGDVVKRGDLLISGILPSELGGGVCYAQGCVVGRMSDGVEVAVGREYERNVRKSEKLYECKVNFFNFSINIFKLYGNSPSECDIIENVKVYSLFGVKKIPISVRTKYIIEYNTDKGSYTDTELVQIASDRLSAAVLKRLVGCDLLKIKTTGRFTDDGYIIRSDLVFLSEVGVTQEFIVE